MVCHNRRCWSGEDLCIWSESWRFVRVFVFDLALHFTRRVSHELWEPTESLLLLAWTSRFELSTFMHFGQNLLRIESLLVPSDG